MKEAIDFIKSLAIFVALALVLRASVVEAFKIPSSSMESTLEIGDHILVNKLSYGLRLPFIAETIYQYDSPKRGDIVVFTLPDDVRTSEVDESDTNIIKRVIGLPGDTVQVKGTQVFINGEDYTEDVRYARWRNGGTKDFGPVTVPEHKVLLLGDNRDFSRDARFWDDPFLDFGRIKGRAFIVYWNTRQMQRIFNVVN